jgi:hypothetical protein
LLKNSNRTTRPPRVSGSCSSLGRARRTLKNPGIQVAIITRHTFLREVLLHVITNVSGSDSKILQPTNQTIHRPSYTPSFTISLIRPSMKWKEAVVVGLVGFFGPFLGCAAIAHFVLHWGTRPSWLAGVALSTTSVAGVHGRYRTAARSGACGRRRARSCRAYCRGPVLCRVRRPIQAREINTSGCANR